MRLLPATMYRALSQSDCSIRVTHYLVVLLEYYIDPHINLPSQFISWKVTVLETMNVILFRCFPDLS